MLNQTLIQRKTSYSEKFDRSMGYVSLVDNRVISFDKS